jgi:hypothetical protein
MEIGYKEIGEIGGIKNQGPRSKFQIPRAKNQESRIKNQVQ